MSFISYLKDTKGELRHVSWPTRKQTFSFTLTVVLISVGTGVFLGVLDFVFTTLLQRYVL